MSITVTLKQGKDKRDVDIPTEWSDMTVEYWGGMANIIKKHYDKAQLKKAALEEDYKKQDTDASAFTDMGEYDFNEYELLKLNTDLFAYVTQLDKKAMQNVSLESVTEVIGTIHALLQEYKPKGLRSFDFEGDKYYFPSEMLQKNTYGDFIESTQLEMYIENMKHGRFDILPEQMAILCRKIDEEYDDDAIPAKAEKFKKLTMDIIWEFSFFLTMQNNILLKLSQSYSQMKIQA